MTSTVIPFGDPLAQKKWAASLFKDVSGASYFSKRFTGEGENRVIQRLTELDSDAGDNIQFDLSVMLRGQPTAGDKRVKGSEENLRFYSDQVNIDQLRKTVSAGGKMTRKRTAHNLRQIAKERLTEWWAAYMDQMYFMTLSGARGVNAEFVESLDYTGHAGNAFLAPDAGHLMFGGSATSKATITATDKMSRTLIERAVAKVRMLRAEDPNTANMLPIDIEGEKHYVCLMSPYQEYDMRNADTAGWLEIQKAAAAAEGKSNPIFKGGLGMINNVVLHSHASVIRFDDYGAGGNLPAARALFMGRQAGVIAYGTAGGLRFFWKEEVDDFGNEPVVCAGTIFGIKKTRFNGRDFGLMSLDTYSAPSN